MNCRGCGRQIPERYLKLDSFECPYCGRRYRRTAAPAGRPASGQRQHASSTRSVANSKPYRKPGQRRQESAWDRIKAVLTRRVWKLPLVAWMALLVVVIALILCICIQATTSNTKDQYNVSEVSLVTDSSQDTAEQTWGERFSENEAAVTDFLKNLFSPYEIRQIEDDLMLTLDYSPSEPDVYYADIDLILPSTDPVGIKQVIEYVVEYMNQNSPYNIGFRIMFMKNENEGICIAAFGSGFDGYSFSSGENGRQEYSTLEEVPDNL